MNRLIELIVFSELVTACRFAGAPTNRSPFFLNATTLGQVREPSAVLMTTGSPPSITATTELVVPRSIPTVFPIATYYYGIKPLEPHTLNACIRLEYQSSCVLNHFRYQIWAQESPTLAEPPLLSRATWPE